MILGRRTQPEMPADAEPSGTEPDTDILDTSTLLADDATADDIAAAAERHRQAADDTAERAAKDRSEAERLLADARAEVARIMTEAEGLARTLTAAAAAAAQEAETLTERGRILGHAAAAMARAEEQERRAAVLKAERARLEAAVAVLDEQIGQREAERDQAEADLTAATAARDGESMTIARNQGQNAETIAAALNTERQALLTRLAAIGEGRDPESWPDERDKELTVALRAATQARQDAVRGMDAAQPDRPEAVARAALEEFRLTIEAQRARIAEEAAAQRRTPPPRAVVHL